MATTSDTTTSIRNKDYWFWRSCGWLCVAVLLLAAIVLAMIDRHDFLWDVSILTDGPDTPLSERAAYWISQSVLLQAWMPVAGIAILPWAFFRRARGSRPAALSTLAALLAFVPASLVIIATVVLVMGDGVVTEQLGVSTTTHYYSVQDAVERGIVSLVFSVPCLFGLLAVVAPKASRSTQDVAPTHRVPSAAPHGCACMKLMWCVAAVAMMATAALVALAAQPTPAPLAVGAVAGAGGLLVIQAWALVFYVGLRNEGLWYGVRYATLSVASSPMVLLGLWLIPSLMQVDLRRRRAIA